MTKANVYEKLDYVYDIDLNNCTLSHADWARKVAEAATNPEAFLASLDSEFREYLAERRIACQT